MPRLTHAHEGGTVHNHTHYTTAVMRAPGAVHSHRYTVRGPWVGCTCDRCDTKRKRADRITGRADR